MYPEGETRTSSHPIGQAVRPETKGIRVLHVLRGHRWGTIERESVRAIEWLQKTGVESFIYLDRYSPLDQALNKKNLGPTKLYPRQTLHTHWSGRLIFFFALRRLIKQHNIQLVHAYYIEDIVSVGMALRTFPEVPFVLSINHEIVKSYRKLWFKPFVARIDRFVVHNPEMMENVWSEMKIHPRKGLVIWPSPIEVDEDGASAPVSLTQEIVIGSYIPPLLRNMDGPQNLFTAIKVLQEKLQRPVRLKLFIDRNLSKSYFVEHLSTFSRPWAKSFTIEICEFDGLYPPFSSIHLWWTLSDEAIEDFSLLALKAHVPIMAPRMPSYIELKQKQPWVGELFKRNDIREMWANAYRVCDNLMDYHENLALSAKVFIPFWNQIGAQERLLKLYDKGIRLRKFLNARKGL